MLVEFSLKLVCSTMCEKMFTFLEMALNLGIFTHAPLHSKLVPSCCHYTLGRGKLLIPPGAFFREFVTSNSRKGLRKL